MDAANGHRNRLLSPNAPLGELLGDVAGQAQGIVRTEVRLAVAQVREEVSTSARRVVLRGIGGVFALLGVVLLLVALVLGLSTIMASWMAVLIAAGITWLVALLLIVTAARASA